MQVKKKLTIVSVSGIHNFIGGAETFNSELCNGLIHRGHRVINLFATLSKNETKHLISDNMFFYELGKLNLFDLNIKGMINLIFELKKIVKTYKPDILYLHLYLPPLAVAIFSNQFQLPKVVHTYGVWHKEFASVNYEGRYMKNRLTKLKYHLGLVARIFFQKLMLNKADGIIALSNFHKNQIVSNLGIKRNKIRIIGGGVNQKNFFPPTKNKDQVKKSLGFSKKKLVCIVSRIEPRKGIIEAIKAMSIVNEDEDASLLIISPHYDCTFLHYLSSCYEAVSKYQLGGKVFFKTGLSNEQLRPYYQMSDCFLMSSVALETFGLTIIEAMKSGTVVIGSKSGNIGELVKAVDPRLVVNKPTPASFAKTILDFFNFSSREKSEIYKKSVNIAKTFDWNVKSKELENYFYQIIDGFHL
jgi:glycosyltransferase involved in cell wall biosynthesis